MADGERIAKAYVEIEADLSKVPSGMNKLSSTVSSKILELQRKTQAQIARTQLNMKVALNAGNMKDFDRLADAQKRLEATMVKVNKAALNQAAAIRAANAAAGQSVPRTPGGGGGGKPGFGSGAGNGAMGLMMVSQFIDDMQYGFRAVVNQIPQLGMAIGSALGMGDAASMKLGASLGIAGVAVNLLITHWDDLMDLMGTGRVLTEAEQMEKLAKSTKLTADEQERLNRYKREEAVGQRLGQKQASGAEKTSGEIEAAIADMGNGRATGFNRLVSGLVQARRAQNRGAKLSPDEEEQLSIIKRDFGGTKYGTFKENELRTKIQTRLDEEDVANAKKTVEGATFDPERRRQLINEIRNNPGAFPEGAASKLGVIKDARNTKDEEERKRDLEVKLANRELERQERENQKAENSRLAAAMKNSVGQKFLANPQMSNETLEQEARKQMGKAGMSSSAIDAAAEGVAKAIRKQMDEEIRGRAMDRGIGEGQAAQQLLKEANELDDRQANEPKSEIMSTESYMSKLLVGALNQKDGVTKDLPQKQLDAAKETNKILANGFKTLANPKKGTYATAAPGGRA